MGKLTTLLTKKTAAQNGVGLSYQKVHGLYFLTVIFVKSICIILNKGSEIVNRTR